MLNYLRGKQMPAGGLFTSLRSTLAGFVAPEAPGNAPLLSVRDEDAPRIVDATSSRPASRATIDLSPYAARAPDVEQQVCDVDFLAADADSGSTSAASRTPDSSPSASPEAGMHPLPPMASPRPLYARDLAIPGATPTALADALAAALDDSITPEACNLKARPNSPDEVSSDVVIPMAITAEVRLSALLDQVAEDCRGALEAPEVHVELLMAAASATPTIDLAVSNTAVDFDLDLDVMQIVSDIVNPKHGTNVWLPDVDEKDEPPAAVFPAPAVSPVVPVSSAAALFMVKPNINLPSSFRFSEAASNPMWSTKAALYSDDVPFAWHTTTVYTVRTHVPSVPSKLRHVHTNESPVPTNVPSMPTNMPSNVLYATGSSAPAPATAQPFTAQPLWETSSIWRLQPGETLQPTPTSEPIWPIPPSTAANKPSATGNKPSTDTSQR
ncbi:hypothetical protein BD626DRAFT_624402 [Schizophyllum amplum]|uniref:Uncharacterized protein n=1 Tax=Schizophyllum amplum TaxID=97359 RepID=A0A550CVZ2_9AGAR|nr:hypothetical protein BD626DRAFT_624402 [Auriculariopsis ampla]